MAQVNRCDYCLAAHCAIGKTIGLSDDAIADARRGTSPDRKVEAALHFAQQVVTRRGLVSEDSLCQLRNAGYTEQEIVEIIANVSLVIVSNYLNHAAGTEIDFPRVPQLTGT